MLWWMRQWRKKMVESNEERKRTGQRVKEWRIQQCVVEQKVRDGERYQERRYGFEIPVQRPGEFSMVGDASELRPV